ncbi:Kelch domain-containing protein 2-like [Homarus americanus]|uniref:Kelch domain-containing protein 2-like n=1 Tax=Homarus americanus TaxID=6706 RepID=A0A8J5JDP2_HOMAM|nr:Kelch domain-containing protein 2-like [Homarus americanus]
MSRQEPIEYQYIHRRAGHVMVAFDNRLFVWGGYMELPHSEPYTLMTPSKCLYHRAIDVFMYDPMLKTWTRRMSNGRIPMQLSGSCAAVHHQHMYLFGGWTSNTSDKYENSSNSLWRLHLPSLTWELLFPDGIPPFPCDKAACWVNKNRFYIFGGFGPYKEMYKMPGITVKFVADDVFPSGWTDQLVYYDIETNMWVWPETHGPKPSPRAAHTADVTGDKVYIFGGRFKDVRMNDLHCLDLNSMRWSGNLTESAIQETPEGRSWHTFNFVSRNKAVIYGGFNTTQQVLTSRNLITFVAVSGIAVPAIFLISSALLTIECTIEGAKPCTCPITDVPSPCSCLFTISNFTSTVTATPDLLATLLGVLVAGRLGIARSHKTQASTCETEASGNDHAEGLLVLRFSPPSLQRLAIEAVCKHEANLREQWGLLPHTLQHILEVRTSLESIS